MSRTRRFYKEVQEQQKSPGFKDRQQYIVTWQSELEIICGSAYHWGEVETGGELYGLFSHGLRPVIMFATPPGPEAIHNIAHFRQDLNFLHRYNSYLIKNYGIQYDGTWHSHHNLGIKGPSKGDINSAHSVSVRNGYRQMCQLVLTFETNPHPNFHSFNESVINKTAPDPESRLNTFRKKTFSKHTDKLRTNFFNNNPINYIQVHSFYYSDSMHGQPSRCSLRVIPGISPIRQAISNNPSDHKLIRQYRYPINRIMFESFQDMPIGNHSKSDPYAWLNNQVSNLPNRVIEDVKVTVNDGLIVFSIPLENEMEILFVAYDAKPPHKAISVKICNGLKKGNLIDFTKEALCNDVYTTLFRIYRKVERHISEKKSISHTNSLPKTENQSAPKSAETNNAEIIHDQKDKINY